MSLIHYDLLTMVDAVTIFSSSRYAVNGESRELPADLVGEVTNDPAPDRRVRALAVDLYERLYTRPTARPFSRRSGMFARRDLIAELSAANGGHGTWEPGWTVRDFDKDGQVIVVKDGAAFWVPANGLRVQTGEIQPNARCRVRGDKHLRSLMPGFYLAIGDAEPAKSKSALVRYYWHLKREVAVPFIATATSLLNEAQIPFRAKVLSDPSSYHRADAGVLYLDGNFVLSCGAIVAEIYAQVAWGLRPDVPLLASRLVDGLGVAYDPGGEQSFGQHRCQLVAQALWDSFDRGNHDRESRVHGLIAAFIQCGLDPARPHLGPGSAEDDSLASILGATKNVSKTSPRSASGGNGLPNETSEGPAGPLETAIRIAERICETAYWDREHRICNWIGRSSREVSELGGPIMATSAALGPELYAGSAGIAIFLSQIAAVSGDPRMLQTSIGAMRRSIRYLDHGRDAPQVSPLSLYFGHLGVAYAARRIGAVTGLAEIDQQADAILETASRAVTSPHVLDTLGGNAGAIPALLWMGKFDGGERFRDLAIVLGQELCRCAVREQGLCLWGAESASGPGLGATPLTGLSHGAAGIGLSLFELYAATGQLEFLETARGAFAYEDSLFDADTANWPDLRFDAARKRFACAWCHGAPGIALARLRAARLDPDRAVNYLDSARIALTTTIRAIDEELAISRADTSLCHGLAGLGEVCLIASQSLEDSSYRDAADSVASALIERYAMSGDWPSGAPSRGPNPSLMLGLAGIGYWFLRLDNPEKVHSVLLFTP